MVLTIENCGALLGINPDSAPRVKKKTNQGEDMIKEGKKTLEVVILKQSSVNGEAVRIGEVHSLPIKDAMQLIYSGKAKLSNAVNKEEAKKLKQDIAEAKAIAKAREEERKAALREKNK